MKEAYKTKASFLSSDKFQLFAVLCDAAIEGLPIAGIASKVSKARDEYQLNALDKKLRSALSEIEGASPALLSVAVNNLKDEFGFDYSEDVFLDAIYGANSTEMARIPGKVFRAYCEKNISLNEYWSLLNVTKILIYPDIRSVLSTKDKHVSELSKDMQQRLQAAGLCYNTSGYGKLGTEWNVDLLNPLILCLEGKSDVKHTKYDPEKFPRSIAELPPAP